MPDFRIISRNNETGDSRGKVETTLAAPDLAFVLNFLDKQNSRDALSYSRMLAANPSNKTMRTRWFHAMVCPDFTATEIITLNKGDK